MREKLTTGDLDLTGSSPEAQARAFSSALFVNIADTNRYTLKLARPKPPSRRRRSELNMPHPLWFKCGDMFQLILASQSPRRRQLLIEAGYNPRVDTVKVSEIIEEKLNLRDAVKRVARTKAEAYIKANKHMKSQRILLVAADTIVSFEGMILGKPQNNIEAVKTLTRLSGKSHSVITAFCVYDFSSGKWVDEAVETKVWFKDLSPAEIESYVTSGEPMDKAGSYGIQGEGGKFVEKYEGSWSNVVGLPMEKFEEVIKRSGWDVCKRSVK